MQLSNYVRTLGQELLQQYGQRIHKLAINAGFTCPNRDGSKGRGGCTFCNNASFNPNSRRPPDISSQLAAGRAVLAKRTGARRFIAYFQAYTNTYADVQVLSELYQQALQEPDVIGLAIGTRPDCVPPAVLDLLCEYQQQGHEVWLELGLQSSFDHTLDRVQRGHGFAEYRQTLLAARQRGLPVCTHLIVGLPGEQAAHSLTSLKRVVELGVDGLKLHPLHIVKHTMLAKQWRQGEYQPLTLEAYIDIVCQLVEHTPPEIVYHRLTGSAGDDTLLAPAWCGGKWTVLNGIAQALQVRGSYQGSALN
ncbi:TIGR01212 family radical SAM protein [Candidatus Venteria ishoeyi]|uniref:Coproporphyrinogen III oxidase n=1 Tax=Candidatus Venteria ishoeyi TaxID=1899563 RepID=A0A1H6F7N2_9GAMM|nr:TIGR01212 family radical SAM protein [Candidatus Venteria ishoeyi]MDM8547610.1 TIGR01212 family radical SAM protein [Candidatus Venteria ishoeyi]SEH06138.1 coproporphyrinogen III oxidase [Candidatus Venteria ishoeyi]